MHILAASCLTTLALRILAFYNNQLLFYVDYFGMVSGTYGTGHRGQWPFSMYRPLVFQSYLHGGHSIHHQICM